MILVGISVLVFWGAIFLLFFQANGRSLGDVFFGPWEPWPELLGAWRPCETPGARASSIEDPAVSDPSLLDAVASPPGDNPNLLWERRLLPERSWLGEFVIIQKRARDPRTQEIIQVLPERRVRRKRRRSSET